MKKSFFILVTAFIFLFIAELVISIFNIDFLLIKKNITYVGGDIIYNNDKELYQRSDDPIVLFQMKPNFSTICTNCNHMNEKEFKDIKFETQKFGGRNVTGFNKEAKKTLIWIGGSFSKGASVTQEHTLQSQLQKYFNEEKLDIKIIDLSANAYIISQKLQRFKNYVKKEGMPDYLIIHDYNGGPSPFFIKDFDIFSHFKKNNHLYIENIHNFFNFRYHNFFVEHSPLYRLVISAYNIFISYEVRKECKKLSKNNCSLSKYDELMLKKMNGVQFNYNNETNYEALKAFIKDHKTKTKILLFEHARNYCSDDTLEFEVQELEQVKNIIFCKGRPSHPDYFEVHPPAYVYRWYGEHFINFFNRYLK